MTQQTLTYGITEDEFLIIMTSLGERFQRNVSLNISNMYLKYLSQNLQPTQILEGFEIVCNEDNFFPSPKRWFEAATGNLESAALAQWDETLAASREDRSSNLDAIAKATWKSLGGREILDKGDSRMFLQIRDKFLEEYALRARAARVNAQALPTPATNPATNPDTEPKTEPESTQTRVPNTFEEWEAMQAKVGAA
jgi:hypothetical protein